MEKIKIAFFLPNLEVGGAERVTLNLLTYLDRSKFEPALLLGADRGYFSKKLPAGILVTVFNTISSVGLFLKLYKYFSHADSDSMFVSIFPRLSVLSILSKICSRSRVKIIVIEHSIFSKTAQNAANIFRRLVARLIFPSLMRLLYRKAEYVICVSSGVADDIRRITGLGNKIRVMYNPIIDEDIERMAQEPVTHPWFLNSQIPVILAVGRLTKAKDYPTLLKAFAVVVKKKPSRLFIIGEGQEHEALARMAQDLGILEWVEFAGLQKNPYQYMAHASLFVLSSQQEGFPTAVIEAMACGAPVIVTDYQPGFHEIIEPGKSGLIVPVKDAQSLANAIITLLEDTDARKEFVKASRMRAKKFTVGEKTKEYEDFFSNIITST